MGQLGDDRPVDGFDFAESDLDLAALLHPAQAFEHPNEVVRDPELTLSEKKAILAAWASDACAVESAPALRALATGKPVTFDDVMDAMRRLDEVGRTKSRRMRKPLGPAASGLLPGRLARPH
jgi:hypothetical protein